MIYGPRSMASLQRPGETAIAAAAAPVYLLQTNDRGASVGKNFDDEFWKKIWSVVKCRLGGNDFETIPTFSRHVGEGFEPSTLPSNLSPRSPALQIDTGSLQDFAGRDPPDEILAAQNSVDRTSCAAQLFWTDEWEKKSPKSKLEEKRPWPRPWHYRSVHARAVFYALVPLLRLGSGGVNHQSGFRSFRVKRFVSSRREDN